MGSMVNPLLAAIMGSIQGDVLNNHVPQMTPQSLPASPSGTVTSQPLAAPGTPAPGTPGAPSPPISGPQTPPSPTPSPGGGGSIPWWANATGADFGNNTPMPRPRPAQAPPMVNQNGSIAGAQGPTSVGGAPLVQPGGPMNIQSPAQQQAMAQPQPQQNGSDLIQKMLQYLQQNPKLSDNPNTASGATFG